MEEQIGFQFDPLEHLATEEYLPQITRSLVEEDGMEEELDMWEVEEEDRVTVALAQVDMPQGFFRVVSQLDIAQEVQS